VPGYIVFSSFNQRGEWAEFGRGHGLVTARVRPSSWKTSLESLPFVLRLLRQEMGLLAVLV
jgi:hypothetical protein